MAKEVSKIKENGFDKDRVIVPLADIYETESEYVIKADMPAVNRDGIDIVLDNNKLEIKGSITENYKSNENIKYREYALYNYHRSFNVGSDIDGNSIEATITNGVLTINLPKKEEVKPKKIEISVQ